MFNNKRHGFCSEFYTVEKSIEVVVSLQGDPEQIRIEALRDERNSPAKYSTRAYRLEPVTLQPTYPKTKDSHDSPPKDFQIWVDYDLPWTATNSADDALMHALGFLRERSS